MAVKKDYDKIRVTSRVELRVMILGLNISFKFRVRFFEINSPKTDLYLTLNTFPTLP
jgi:hypothetical protein